MSTLRAVHHLAVVVSDLEASERFYGGVLGLPIETRHDDDRGAHRSTWFRLRGAFLAVELAHEDEPRRSDEAPGWHCVALAIAPDERSEWMTRFEEHGIPVFRTTDYTVYVRDPDGNIVALSHFPEAETASLP